jgi:AcrR family transcriptional regulator
VDQRPKSVAQGREEPPGAPPRRSGRPRSQTARRAVLEAAYAVLEEAGMGAFSIEAVALRSGVARTTIYRWWPTKGALAIESFLEEFRPRLNFTRTGAADADFRALVASLAAALSGPAGRVAASVVAQSQSDTETQRLFREQFSEPLRLESSRLLHEGTDQGLFRADLDIPRVIDAYTGAIYLCLLLGYPLDADWARALTETLLNGCLPR